MRYLDPYLLNDKIECFCHGDNFHVLLFLLLGIEVM